VALPAGSVGIDHNPHSIDIINSTGLIGFLPNDFRNSSYYILAGTTPFCYATFGAHVFRRGNPSHQRIRAIAEIGRLAILIARKKKASRPMIRTLLSSTMRRFA